MSFIKIWEKETEHLAYELFPEALLLSNDGKLSCNGLEMNCIFNTQPLPEFGHISTTFCIKLAALIKRDSVSVANEIAARLKRSEIKKIEIAKNGFLNLFFEGSYLISVLVKIAESLKTDPRSLIQLSSRLKEPVLLEFLSANPTGPLHAGHIRQAVLGDAIARILRFCGYKLDTEYYINDYGNQARMLGKSILYHCCDIAKKPCPFEMTEDMYHGSYVREIAEEIISESHGFEESFITKRSVQKIMEIIKRDIESLGIEYDFFTSESDIVSKVTELVSYWKDRSDVGYEQMEVPKYKLASELSKSSSPKLVFRSDSRNVSLYRDDGSWTYFAVDSAYHFDKVRRGYATIIDLLGYDHHDYQKSIESAFGTFGSESKLIFATCHLVKMIDSKTGEIYPMSKRAGKFLSLQELLSYSSADAIKLNILSKTKNHEIILDPKRLSEFNDNNPFFYIQYAHARCCSILERSTNDDLETMTYEIYRATTLTAEEENVIISLISFSQVISDAAANLEPSKIVEYLIQLSKKIHLWWNLGTSDADSRILSPDINKRVYRRFIIDQSRIVIATSLEILGVVPINRL